MGDQRRETRAILRRRLLSQGPVRQLVLGGGAIVVIGAVMAAASGMPLLAAVIAGAALIMFGLCSALYIQTLARAQRQASLTAHQPYPAAADDLDEPSRALLQRAACAIDAITSSQVCREGLLDRAAVRRALANQQRDIERGLREQFRLHAMQAGCAPPSAGPTTTDTNGSPAQPTQLTESGLAARVDALERYAAEIRAADTAYREWQDAVRPTGNGGQGLEALARTAAEQHRIAEIETMSQQARAVRLALREPPA